MDRPFLFINSSNTVTILGLTVYADIKSAHVDQRKSI